MQESNIQLHKYSAYFIYFALVFVAIIYLPVLSYDYVWDDKSLFTSVNFQSYDNWFLKSISEPFFVSDNYYRPIVVASFAAEIILFDGNPFISHLINYVLLIICTYLLYAVLLRELQIDNPHKTHVLATCGALIFCLHPALTENIAWISGRFDLLMTTFILACLYINTLHINENFKAFLIGFFFLAASLCKEMTIAFAVCLPFIHAIQNTTENPFKVWLQKENLKIYAAITIGGLLYLMIRYSLLGYIYTSNVSLSHPIDNPLEKTLLIFKSVYFYFRQLFFPFIEAQVFYPLERPIQVKDQWVIFGMAITFFLIFLTANKSLSLKSFTISTCLAFFPVLHFLPMTISDNIGHNRFVIFPMVIFLVGLSRYLSINKFTFIHFRMKVFILSLWLILSTLTTASIIPLWKSNLLFWQWNYSNTKNSTTVILLSQELMRVKKYKLAEEILTSYKFSNLEKKNRGYKADYYTILGRVYEKTDQIDKAEKYLTLASEVSTQNKNLARILTSLASIKIKKQDFAEVERLLQLAITLDSIYSPAYETYAIYLKSNLNAKQKASTLAQQALDFSINTQHYNEIKIRLDKYNLP